MCTSISFQYHYYKRNEVPSTNPILPTTDYNYYDKEFDVFISYSHFDKDFVEDFLVPKLEDESNIDMKYQCLLHVRDFEPGRAIMDQINEAVDSSACTIIVLSKNFVESQWARHE